ncbi:hypothetical protein N7486_008107 [Penicillium sp. IBT 16267x]|nr:hypothetical protein N7486_008107 [Penicillium sp. IBT 16267x]
MPTRKKKPTKRASLPPNPTPDPPAKLNLNDLVDPVFDGPMAKFKSRDKKMLPKHLSELTADERKTYQRSITNIDDLARFAKPIRTEFEGIYIKTGKLRGPYTRFLLQTHTHPLIEQPPIEAHSKMPESFQPRPGSPDVEPLPELENRKRALHDSLKKARKRVKGNGSFDHEYWMRARQMADIELAKSQVQRKMSLQTYDGEEAT